MTQQTSRIDSRCSDGRFGRFGITNSLACGLQHFFDGCQSLADFAEAVITEGDHPRLDGAPADFGYRKCRHNSIAEVVVDNHQLVQTNAAAVAGVEAMATAR